MPYPKSRVAMHEKALRKSLSGGTSTAVHRPVPKPAHHIRSSSCPESRYEMYGQQLGSNTLSPQAEVLHRPAHIQDSPNSPASIAEFVTADDILASQLAAQAAVARLEATIAAEERQRAAYFSHAPSRSSSSSELGWQRRPSYPPSSRPEPMSHHTLLRLQQHHRRPSNGFRRPPTPPRHRPPAAYMSHHHHPHHAAALRNHRDEPPMMVVSTTAPPQSPSRVPLRSLEHRDSPKDPTGGHPAAPPVISLVPSYTEGDRKYVDSITDMDILCGRGGKSNHHPGNKKYRQVVGFMKYKYQNCPAKTQKTDLSRTIVDYCHSYGGRFVKKDTDYQGERYYVLTKDEARKKTSQALRETKVLKWTS